MSGKLCPVPVESAARTLFDLFEATVRRHGDRIAVEVQKADGLDRFTYSELHGMATDRAAWLRAEGVQPGDRCAILAHNDAHWCAAYLGILACGAVAVPLDTNYSAAQVATILRDSGARVLFVDVRLNQVAHQATASVDGIVVLDTHAPSTRLRSPDDGARATARQASGTPAVILYTSGTTSDPKGVVLTHANLLAECDAALARVSVSERDTVLGVLPLFHSLAQLANLVLPFAVGARVVFLEVLGSQELMQALAERQVTVFACVPQFFNLIHERVTKEAERRGPLSARVFRALLAVSFRLRRAGINLGPLLFARVHRALGRQMRFIVTGGSRFDPAIGRDFYAMGLTIRQAYGLTETSGAATLGDEGDAWVDTVGRPLPGVEIRILEALPEPESERSRASPAPDHGDGEIAIRGAIVTPGYYNRPDLTAASMKDGWFLTGDLGRMDSRGRLTITGRKKEMIILANGKNLYPEEIEAHYRQSAFVKEICITTAGAGETHAPERLHAIVVPDMVTLGERKIVNAGELLRFELEGLGAGLPSYKRIHGYDIWFEPLPRTTTGKLKRHEIARRLVERHREQETPSTDRLPDPWLDDPHVAAVAAVVRARVPAGARLAADVNLELGLGLDSMSRVELLADLERRFGIDVPADEASRMFTLGQLVEAVRPDGSSPPGPVPDVEAAGRAPDGEAASWAALLGDLPAASDPVLGALLARRPFAEPFLHLLGRALRLMLARVEVSGLDRLPSRGAYLICPNHQSYLDPVFVSGVLPYRTFANTFFVGAVEYFDTPFTGWVARKINLVPVDPDSNLVPAMKASAFGLAHGKVLVLFPEGERSIDGTVRKFKKGAAILSRHMQVPVVPVALKGAHEIWPRGGRFDWRVLLPWRRRRVRLEFGEPLLFAEDETYGESAERLREKVDAAWRRLDIET